MTQVIKSLTVQKFEKISKVWIFIILTLLFYADKIILWSFALIKIHDALDLEFPLQYNQGQLLLKYGLFAWYSGFAGGMPAYAWHHAPLNIASLLSIIMPMWALYGLSVIILMIVSGYGMYRFLREYLNLPDWLSIVGGLVFMFSSQVQAGVHVHIVFSYTFPLFFMWFLDITQTDRILKDKITALIGLNLILLFAHPVLTLPFYPILHFCIILLFNINQKNMKKLLVWCIVIWTGYILTWAPVLYGLMDFMPYVQRTYDIIPSLINSIEAFGYYPKRESVFSLMFTSIVMCLFLIGSSKKLKRLFLLIFIFTFAAFFHPICQKRF